ncbi:MAG: hypothetical protein HQL90_06550 [Magnetococcales bacterium]|nr:hypothetical protein [Magnetococcales bacterium]
MNKKFAIIGDIVVGFLNQSDRTSWLHSHPSARIITPRHFPQGKRVQDAVPVFLYDAICQEFPPDQAEFCIQTMWNDAGKEKKPKKKPKKNKG